MVIYLENAELSDVLANGSYERYLAAHFAFAGLYYSVGHASLRNYLVATSGVDSSVFKVVGARNVGDLAEKRGLSWSAFMESMPTPCNNTSSGLYDALHNPFVLYSDVVTNLSRCTSHDVSLTSWTQSVGNGTLPNYSFVAPNLLHDAHSTNVSYADRWLRGWLPTLVNSSLFASTAVFLTYDEGTTILGAHGRGGGHIYLSLISPFARMGYTSSVRYNHYDLLTTTEWLLGLGRTGHHDNWTLNPPMEDLFQFLPTFLVSGTVTDTLGHPLAGATVSDGNGTSVVTTLTGNFSLQLANGTYSLTAHALGYTHRTIVTTVAGHNVSSVRFVLR